ncbi:MAG: phage portal protein [Faecalibacterium sp.]|nr:phage portal protein [Faecalibacterium sp.]
MTTTFSFGTVPGLTGEEQRQLTELTEAYNYHQSRNATKDKYYEGHVTLQDVNLGIALPKGLSKLEVGCNWGQKAVDALASRSMFDGFVSNSGALGGLQKLVTDNRLVSAYAKACRDQLKYGCVFATLSADADIGCRIRFNSPATASALWSGEKGRIDCGFAIIDTVQDEHQKDSWRPALVNFYTDTAVIVLRAVGSSWAAERKPHRMGRPLMEPLIWNATSNKPFGRSRLKRAIRSLIDDYVRTVANATIALEFDTTPQKYILGVTDEQYDAISSDKFKQYVGALIAATSNPETGENPVFGQLAQGSLQPHVEKMRMTATQFAAATGLTVTDVGVVNDANPTSSDAILAQSQTLVLMAQQLNTGNGDALHTIACMAQAIARNVSLTELTEEERGVMAHFKNPAMPSVAVTADAAIKIATARQEFASTDTFLEMIGFDQADIRRIRAQEQRARGQALLMEMDNADNDTDVE